LAGSHADVISAVEFDVLAAKAELVERAGFGLKRAQTAWL
jgi:hypothetical protein